MDADDDLALLAAWQAGDASAGANLVERHIGAVYRFFYGKVDADVGDLVQRTFLACVEARGKLAPGGAFKPYLLGIARYQLLMHLRTPIARRPFETLAHEPRHPTGDTVDRVADRRERQRLLFAALRTLPCDAQLLIELFYWEELKVDEIAEVLDIRPGTVKARLFKVRRDLELAMVELANNPEVAAVTLEELPRWAEEIRARRPESADPRS